MTPDVLAALRGGLRLRGFRLCGLRLRGFRRPVIATGRAMAAIAGASYLVGGAIGLACALLAGERGRTPVLALAVLAILLGCGLGVVAVRGIRMSPAVYYALAVVAIGAIGIGVRVERGQILAMALAAQLTLVTIFAFAFFTWPAAWVLQFLSVVTLLVAKLQWDAVPWAAVIAMSGQNVILGVILGWLVRAAARAETDDLTGLPDRRGFDRALDAATARAARSDRPLSIAFLDLDDFGAYNAQQGVPAGDRLLQAVGHDLVAVVADDTVVARSGSDRFALIVPAAGADTIATLERFRADDRTRFSAGVAGWRPGDTPATLAGRADTALDEARRAGGSRIFCSADTAADSWAEMASALTAGEFTVAYQPITDLKSGAVTGAEALLRWTRPGRGPVSPVDFIPQAERSGFVAELGRFVLESACREAATWTRAVPAKVAVNVSGRELHQHDYYEQVAEVLIASGLPPERLVLEVTESTLEADSPIALTTLRRLRALGIRVAIDDFGTGWSSLSRLSHLPADILKIDRSFVAAIPPEATSAPLITAITALASAMGLRTVAEGVEEVHQAALLARHGCDEGQGWLHGRPGDGAVIREALRTRGDALPAPDATQRTVRNTPA
ncbi:putative bifunctional diguanylate cyclase/phosphodiesterase [Cryptosporangium sp. NPDC051539]|uniref:putative bifunctional diguanylate cyclase/phosphodiesterase n=1 Tax=Cryptosporangium sp. NPDC051539 TaxID=3363962 RepID=UPI0037AAC589